MIFLPIVGRELRVAARKRSTFWVRIAAALVALIIGSGMLLLTTLGGWGFGQASMGRGLFTVLTWLCLAGVLSAGLFLTSDCLSEEKREGTIGFLFLTDLSGLDVVLGKLLATSLRGFFSLLAVFPILGITLLMGGVTGAQFWKTELALVNGLFFSLTAGLFVSTISRESQKALAGTLFLLLIALAGGPILDSIITLTGPAGFGALFSLTSPGYLFVAADAWGRRPFWLALLVNQAIGWMLLGAACMLLPRTWQEKAVKGASVKGGWAYRWKFGGVKRQAALRLKLLGLNPVLWLACRERWQAGLVWLVALVMAGGTAALVPDWHHSTGWYMWSYIGGIFMLLLYLGIASQAGRFFVEAQRNGVLELLLVTPLTAKHIVQGQWRALLRMFTGPLALCLVAQLVGTVMLQEVTWRKMAATVTAAPPATIVVTNKSSSVSYTNVLNRPQATIITSSGGATFFPGQDGPGLFMTLLVCVLGTLTVAGNLAALTWFGMWMGLNSKSSNIATLKTVAFVQVIPWFAASFASMLMVSLLMFPLLIRASNTAPGAIRWYPLLMSGVGAVLYLAKDIGFLLWSRRKLYSDFRRRAVRVLVPIGRALPALPPPLPPATLFRKG